MITGKRLARIPSRDHRLTGQKVGERDIGRIAIVAVGQDEIGGPLESCIREDVFDQHAFPLGVELRP